MVRRGLQQQDGSDSLGRREPADYLFRAIVEASPTAILMVDANGAINLANSRTEELFGYSAAELLGQNIEMLVPERYRVTHGDYRRGFLHNASARPMGAGRDLFCRRKDGTEVAVEIGLSPIQTQEGIFVLASIIDITERKRGEEQSRLQTRALECAANGIVITDRSGNIVWVNRAFTDSTGYAPEEVIGENPRLLKSGQQDDRFYRKMWQTILSGQTWHDTIVNRRKDQTLVYEDMTITPIQNAADEITHFIAIKQDISDRVRDQEALQEANEKLQTFISASPLAIIALDMARRVTLWNPAAEKLFGWTEAEAIGSVLPTIADEDLPNQLKLRQQFILRGETISDLETQRMRKDGSLVDVSVSFAPLHDSRGEINGTMGIIADITERKNAETERLKAAQQYRLLFEENPAPMWVYDRETLGFIAVNEAAVSHYGYSRADFLAMNISDIRPPEEVGRLVDILADPAGRVSSSGIWKHRKKDGSLIDVEIIASTIDFDGRPAQLVLAKDVTDQLKAEREVHRKSEELSTTTQQLWQASKLATMGELAASVAHELNNPLATIALRTELLREQLSADSGSRNSADVILNEVERMAALVDNLLQFSRRGQRQISTVCVSEEISKSVDFIHYYLRNRNVTVEPQIGSDLLMIHADRQQLRQLFLNLLTNAADAMAGGGKLITRAERLEINDAPYVQIEFIDQGIGISPEHLERIWESFFTTKPEGKGTGLGLGICRRIVEEHGGTIEIESELNRGTTVRVRFPGIMNEASHNG